MIFEESVSVTKQLHQFLLVAASLKLVEERGELLVIEFYPLTRRDILLARPSRTACMAGPITPRE